ncbi:hypothetical protein BGZ83_007214 [Gryganskiella cystojenkinii]|nr:hypothetical protein BGZ83_007214 [Gryganskiella cystojenkinii]
MQLQVHQLQPQPQPQEQTPRPTWSRSRPTIDLTGPSDPSRVRAPLTLPSRSVEIINIDSDDDDVHYGERTSRARDLANNLFGRGVNSNNNDNNHVHFVDINSDEDNDEDDDDEVMFVRETPGVPQPRNLYSFFFNNDRDRVPRTTRSTGAASSSGTSASASTTPTVQRPWLLPELTFPAPPLGRNQREADDLLRQHHIRPATHRPLTSGGASSSSSNARAGSASTTAPNSAHSLDAQIAAAIASANLNWELHRQGGVLPRHHHHHLHHHFRHHASRGPDRQQPHYHPQQRPEPYARPRGNTTGTGSQRSSRSRRGTAGDIYQRVVQALREMEHDAAAASATAADFIGVLHNGTLDARHRSRSESVFGDDSDTEDGTQEIDFYRLHQEMEERAQRIREERRAAARATARGGARSPTPVAVQDESSSGLTKIISADTVIVCPGCRLPFGHSGTEHTQLWVVWGCGHVICGECVDGLFVTKTEVKSSAVSTNTHSNSNTATGGASLTKVKGKGRSKVRSSSKSRAEAVAAVFEADEETGTESRTADVSSAMSVMPKDEVMVDSAQPVMEKIYKITKKTMGNCPSCNRRVKRSSIIRLYY